MEAAVGKAQELITTARREFAGAGVIPVAEFNVGSSRMDGRPARSCMPVLQHWRNERVVYQRAPESKLPTVRGVEISLPGCAAQEVKAENLPSKTRRRGRLARVCVGGPCGAGAKEESRSDGAVGSRAPAPPALGKAKAKAEEPVPISDALCETSGDSPGSRLSDTIGEAMPALKALRAAAAVQRSQSSSAPPPPLVQLGAEAAVSSCPTCGCHTSLAPSAPAQSPAKAPTTPVAPGTPVQSPGQAPASAAPTVEQEEAEVATSEADSAAEEEEHSLLLPARPCLRRQDAAPRLDKSSADGQQRSAISFAEGSNRVTTIQNFSQCGETLWYPGFAVCCDRCDQDVEWGAEGGIAGAPGRSRFSQWQVLCNSCLADRLYGQMGAWLVVALAACANEDPAGASGVAQEPVTNLMDSLLSVGPQGASSDLLVALLGPEAEALDVKLAVLRKARDHIPRLLGSTLVKQEVTTEEMEPASQSAAGAVSPSARAEGEEVAPEGPPRPSPAQKRGAVARGAAASKAQRTKRPRLS